MVNLQTDGANNVKVKLTTRLAIGAGLLVSAHSIARRPVRRGEVVTRGGVKQVWSSRGEGWDVTPGLCAKKISTDEGGLSQSPPSPQKPHISRNADSSDWHHGCF